jgi:hypothetical protein
VSQQAAEAWGNLTEETLGKVGAAPTTPGRASTARWRGLGLPVRIVTSDVYKRARGIGVTDELSAVPSPCLSRGPLA